MYDEVRPITSLFADVVGSTFLGERLGPAEIKALIGECVTRMTRAIESYGGAVRSYMGDGIAAFFGMDVAREDDPIRAGLAGLRIIEVISEYAREIESAWSIPSVDVRVGINSGRVATGLVGSADPQHVALGDAVNVAARLQARAEPGSIVVGSATAGRLGGRFELDRLGQLEVRGRLRPVEAWRLIRYLGEPVTGHQGRFVGRQREVDHLDQVLSEIRLGRGRIVVIVGEPGLGKSRLLSECRNRAVPEILWLAGRCSYQQVLRPYGPFVDMLAQWLGVEPDTPQVVSRVRLLARLKESLGSDAETVLPYLGQLLGVDNVASTPEAVLSSNEHRAAELRRAYTSWISALTDQTPVIVALDDVERADASTKTLLGELFELAESAPLMVILALRDEPSTTGWEARVDAVVNHSHRTRELRLEPLCDDDGDELVALIDADGLLTPAIRCELRTRAEGNPLYLEELARTAIEAVSDPNATSPTDGEDVDLGLPAALQGLLLARIDRVSPRARSALQVAAVFGRRFPRWVLEATSDLPSPNQEIGHLVREGLIHEDGLTPSQYYAFKHGLYQEAVLDTLTPDRARKLHEVVAKALEAGAAGDQALEEVASHYVSSGNSAKAIVYLERAGERAASLSSLTEARELIGHARHLSLALEDKEAHLRLSRRFAELARQMGQYAEASVLWRELLSAATAVDQEASLLLEIARTEFELGNGESAALLCEEGLRKDAKLTINGDLLLLMAAILLRENRLDRVKGLLQQVDALGDVLPVPVRAQRQSIWAGYYAASGDPTNAERCATETLKLATEHGDPALILRAKRDLGIIHFITGRLKDAQLTLEDVYACALESGHAVRAQEAVTNLVMVHLHLGQLGRAVTIGLEALGWIHKPFWRAGLLVNLAQAEKEMGDPMARAHFVECSELCEGNPESKTPGAMSALQLGELSLDDDDIRGAVAALKTVANEFGSDDRVDVQVKVSAHRAKVALATGELSTALEHANRAVELAGADKTELPAVLRLVGQVELALDQPGAIGTLKDALRVAQSMSMRLEEGRSLMAIGVAEGKAPSRYFHRAREIFAACGCERGLAEVKQAVASVRSA